MTQSEVLLVILGVLVVANVVLVASIPLRTRRRRRSATRASLLRREAGGEVGRGDRGAADDAGLTAEEARVAAAIEAFVSGASTEAPGRARPPAALDPIPLRRARDLGSPGVADDRAPATTAELAPRSSTPDWSIADLADSAAWSRTIREESARVARFGHPVTVVIAELPHLDMLADRFGPGIADRVASETARLLVSETRAADRIARLGDARVGVMLLETEGVAAARYIERVRAATDRWLESSGLSIRMSFGSAVAGERRDVQAAAADAEQRMHDVDHGTAPRPIARAARPKNA